MKPKLSKSRDHEMCYLFLLLRYFIISKVVNYMKIFFSFLYSKWSQLEQISRRLKLKSINIWIRQVCTLNQSYGYTNKYYCMQCL